ncbi:MAG: succinate dehydrogenase assembly factor 4 [Pseudomonadota bacterium]
MTDSIDSSLPHGKSGSDDKSTAKKTSCSESKSSDSVVSHKEVGGPRGLEPTRFGDWEKNGRCIDF